MHFDLQNNFLKLIYILLLTTSTQCVYTVCNGKLCIYRVGITGGRREQSFYFYLKINIFNYDLGSLNLKRLFCKPLIVVLKVMQKDLSNMCSSNSEEEDDRNCKGKNPVEDDLTSIDVKNSYDCGA